MWMGFAIALICLGILLLHAGLFLLLPWSVTAKAVLGMALGLAYLIIGGAILQAAFNEKTWMDKSGAVEMLKDATDQSNPD